ncbi:MAG: hypothetical protein FWE47_00465 [Oscillospiraceae bacterium]|nr:hypothetical protein [Oscillospiraceae bacterium]
MNEIQRKKLKRHLLLGILPLMLFLIHLFTGIFDMLGVYFALISFAYMLYITFAAFRKLFYIWIGMIVFCGILILMQQPTGNEFIYIPIGLILGIYIGYYGIPIIGIIAMIKDIRSASMD